MYNFDEIIDRRGSGCIKYDCLKGNFGRDDLTPLWVADMDFRTPDFIVDALKARMGHEIFGYVGIPDDYFPAIAAWVERLHGWKVAPEDIRYIPGIVKGIALALECLVPKGGKVLIQPPVYYPFRNVPERMGYEVVTNPLKPVYDAEGFLTDYQMDFEDLERKLDNGGDIGAIIISNPHNPCGIAWKAETLKRLAEIAGRYDVPVISDEIHCEMVLGGRTHVPYASVAGKDSRCITFMAPSKTFNIAGIVSSYAIIGNSGLRERFFSFLDATEQDCPAIFPIVATKAAYTKGWEWRKQMLDYVQGNIDFVDSWFRNNLPQVRVVRPQASFLVWLDCRKTGFSHDELVGWFVDKARLALNDGAMFGAEGSGFMRLNVGCPRSVLEDSLKRLI